MAEKKRRLMEEVQGLNEERDATFISQILVIVRLHKQRRKEKKTERK